MRNPKRYLGKAAILILAGLLLTLTAAAQQSRREAVLERKIDLGRGMSLINADLMQVAAQTDLFLRLGDKIGLSDEQRKRLGELYFDIQKYTVRGQADLDVADAELRRLLSNDRVDLATVRLKVKELETLQTEFTMKKIEIILQSVNTLTHDQHLKAMLLVRELLEQRLQPAPQAG
jgi:Spy/CpxP family protein refolding chaperone